MFFPKLVITIVLMLTLFFFIHQSEAASYSSRSSHNGDHGGGIASIAHQKVNLSVYYDSLSLPCATFIVKDLRNIFDNDLISILNLQLVPWASAYINNTNDSISCQNGPHECELSSLESCALYIWSNVDMQYEMINCLEYSAIDERIEKWSDCLNQLGLPKKAFLNCFNTGNGTELGKSYIKQIAQLDPPHSSVPWLVVNNQPIGKDYANFTHHVCKAYRGAAVPEVCKLPLK
ncbi:hypothetical protein Fmac_012146 [Flemingia macrophylla]|uniref:Uncharacterized protein n=1 Tax=Flemingia macrophylla TaxID=520843 RepID=A0ABD1MRK1_9FABA